LRLITLLAALDPPPAVFSYKKNKIAHKGGKGVGSRATKERGRTGGMDFGAARRRAGGYLS
jgi:hypothetical protein